MKTRLLGEVRFRYSIHRIDKLLILDSGYKEMPLPFYVVSDIRYECDRGVYTTKEKALEGLARIIYSDYYRKVKGDGGASRSEKVWY